jgi:GDPmannose 4,6-dehydratase
MLQQDAPDDYVIASGVSHSVREFVEKAFDVVELPRERFVRTDSRLYRPTEIHELRGDAKKARQKLGWSPCVNFEQIVETMVEADLKRLGTTVGT